MGEVKHMIADSSRISAQRDTAAVRYHDTVRPIVASLQCLRYRAVWRSKQLIILPLDCHPFRQSVSAVLEDDCDRLADCLKHSGVHRLLLSPDLPVAELCCWAELGSQAGLQTYIMRRGSKAVRLNTVMGQPMMVCIGQAASLILLIVTSPVLLSGAIVFWLCCGYAFERQWEISPKRQLYRMRYFPQKSEQLPNVLTGFCHPKIRQLPHLFNALLGQITISQAFKSRDIDKQINIAETTIDSEIKRHLSEADSPLK